MSGLRVLEAITPSRIGGAEVFVANAIEMMTQRGAQIRLFCPSGRPFVDYASARGIPSANWKTHGKLDPLTIVRLARLARSHRADVIHTHLSTASLLGALAAKLARVPSVAHVHGLNTATCFRYSTAVIAVSEAVKKHLVSQGLAEKRTRVIHNGVDLAQFAPAPLADAKRAAGRDPEQPLLGVFGRLSPEKGQRVALEAMFLVLKERPDARLVIVGDGKERDDLGASAEALGIAESVEFAGFVAHAGGLMAACDAVVVPSLKEGFGLVAVEAMALERPVVASAVGGLSEIVLQEQTGLLVEPNDPQTLSRAMLRVIQDDSLARAMGRAGREQARVHFDIQKQIGMVLDTLSRAGST